MNSNDVDSEIVACLQFLESFNEHNDTSTIRLTTESLSEAIHENCIVQNNLLLLYLHNARDEFSINFCCFLQNPAIEELFNSSSFSILAWSIESDDLNDVLASRITSILGPKFSDFISIKKSAVLLIGKDNKVPHVLHIYQESTELIDLDAQLHTYKKFYKCLESNSMSTQKMTSRNYLQLMLDKLGDRDYDCFEPNQHNLLKEKIGFALYGPPKEIGGYCDEEQKKNIEKLYEKITKNNDEFSKWNGKVVISFIFICVEPLPAEKQKRKMYFKKKWQEYDPDIDFEVIPVFVLRKCKTIYPNIYQKTRRCRIVIDKDGRVYQSWEHFLENNKLPPCVLVLPKDGRYETLPNDSKVLVDERHSPSCKISTKIAGTMDTVLGIGGMVAGGIAIFATAPIVAAPAVVVGLASGLYATARSVVTIADRSKHGQELSPKDAESRAAYLNIAGGVLNVAMLGSIKTASYLASRGVDLGQGTKFALFGLNGVALTVGGLGIGNNVYELIKNGQTPSPLQIVQLGASIFFFGNSLYNFRAVGTVIEESQARALADIENNLRSNRHRRTFNKMLSETMRKQGETKGKAEVISSIRKMDNVDEVLATLTRSGKSFHNKGIRYSMNDGQIHLNGVPVNIMEMGSMSAVDRSSFLQSLPPIAENLTPRANYSITREVHNFLGKDGLDVVYKLGTAGSVNKFVEEILSAFEPKVRNFILEIAKEFIRKLDVAMVSKLEEIFPLENVYVMVTRWIVKTLQDTSFFKRILKREELNFQETNEVLSDLNNNFPSWFTQLILDDNKKRENKEIRRRGKYAKRKKYCRVCTGYYYIC